jgi:hypothetical protein
MTPSKLITLLDEIPEECRTPLLEKLASSLREEEKSWNEQMHELREEVAYLKERVSKWYD